MIIHRADLAGRIIEIQGKNDHEIHEKHEIYQNPVTLALHNCDGFGISAQTALGAGVTQRSLVPLHGISFEHPYRSSPTRVNQSLPGSFI